MRTCERGLKRHFELTLNGGDRAIQLFEAPMHGADMPVAIDNLGVWLRGDGVGLLLRSTREESAEQE